MSRGRPWLDRERVEALAREGRAALDATLAELGRLRRARHTELWDTPIREALAGARPDPDPAATAWRAAQEAWWTLARTARGIAHAEARRHVEGLGSTSLELADLRSSAELGCYRAAQRWDPAAPASWPTWARKGARLELRRALREARPVTSTQQERRLSLRLRLDDLERRGRPALVSVVAAELGLDPEYARAVLAWGAAEVRLDAPPPGRERGRAIDDLAAEPWEPEGQIEADRRAEAVRRRVAELSPRHQRVLSLRVAGVSLRQVGAELGVSAQRIYQLEMEGRRALRPLLAADLGLDDNDDTDELEAACR